MGVRIWEDNWLPNQQGFKMWSPKPVGCDISHVFELIDFSSGSWKRDILQQLFLPFEALWIEQIPLASMKNDDQLVWADSPTSFFTVKSAYHCIRRTWKEQEDTSPSAANSDPVWKKLWKIQVLPRFAHFLWRALKGIIPTRQKLWNTGVRCPMFCPRCDNVTETVEHALMDCPWSRRVWFASPLVFSWPNVVDQSFSAWCHEVIISAPKEVGEIFATVCYHIWKARNLLCFEGKDSSEQMVVSHAMATLTEFQETQKQIRVAAANANPRSGQLWRAPEIGVLKVNVDASGSGSSRGLAVVVRNSFGNVVAAATKAMHVELGPEYAEVCAIQFGISFALEREFSAIALESDWKGMVDAILRRKQHGSYLGLVLNRIDSLKSRFMSFSIVHVGRNAKYVAHELSQFSLQNSDRIWLGTTPYCIQHYVLKDINISLPN